MAKSKKEAGKMEKRQLKEYIITIKGMHCKSCVERIEEKLLQIDGVSSARVSLVEEKAYVSFDSSKTNLDEIKSEIENIGYRTGDKDNTGKGSTKNTSIKQGIIYGLIPHIGCIMFIIGSILGVTVLTQLFKPLLLNRYFFHILIGISFLFATISSIIYLKKQGFIGYSKNKGGGSEISFSLPQIIRRKWKYLSTMYGSTIGVNLLLFFVVFPLLANVSLFAPSVTGAAVEVGTSSIRLQVDIPCSGHASLISGELKTIDGVTGVKFSLPNIFDVRYDPAKTSEQQILALDVFKTYKATVISESQGSSNNQINNVVSTESAVKSGSGGDLAAVTNGVQTVQLSVQGSNYYPNPIRVKKGIPVQLVADMNNMPGCSRSIIIPEFGIRKVVSTGDNVIQFTPDKSGTFQFSCSMGMYRGQIIVEEADGSVAAYTGSAQVPSGGSCGGSGGGCGCGGR